MHNIDITLQYLLFQHITVNDFVNTAPIGHGGLGAYISIHTYERCFLILSNSIILFRFKFYNFFSSHRFNNSVTYRRGVLLYLYIPKLRYVRLRLYSILLNVLINRRVL